MAMYIEVNICIIVFKKHDHFLRKEASESPLPWKGAGSCRQEWGQSIHLLFVLFKFCTM